MSEQTAARQLTTLNVRRASNIPRSFLQHRTASLNVISPPPAYDVSNHLPHNQVSHHYVAGSRCRSEPNIYDGKLVGAETRMEQAVPREVHCDSVFPRSASVTLYSSRVLSLKDVKGRTKGGQRPKNEREHIALSNISENRSVHQHYYFYETLEDKFISLGVN